MGTPKFCMSNSKRQNGCYIQYEMLTLSDPDADPRDYLFQDAEYHEQDQARLDAYNRGEWEMIGIRARAHISIVTNGASFNFSVDSAGLWGIEDDSDPEYLAEVYVEQVEELKRYLSAIKV